MRLPDAQGKGAFGVAKELPQKYRVASWSKEDEAANFRYAAKIGTSANADERANSATLLAGSIGHPTNNMNLFKALKTPSIIHDKLYRTLSNFSHSSYG